MPEPRTRLRLKWIDRVALVDRGDNPEAHVVLSKRAPGAVGKRIVERDGKFCVETADGSRQMGCHATRAEAEAQLAAVEANKREDGGTMSDAAAAKRTADDAAVQEVADDAKRAADDAKRAADVAAIEKRIEEAEKRAQQAEERVAKLELERRTAEHVRKAAALAHLPIKPEEFGIVLRKVHDGEALTEAERQELDRVLTAANETARASALFAEIGSGASAEGSATAKAEARADALRKAEPKLTREQALAKVYREDPDLRRDCEREEADARRAQAAATR